MLSSARLVEALFYFLGPNSTRSMLARPLYLLSFYISHLFQLHALRDVDLNAWEIKQYVVNLHYIMLIWTIRKTDMIVLLLFRYTHLTSTRAPRKSLVKGRKSTLAAVTVETSLLRSRQSPFLRSRSESATAVSVSTYVSFWHLKILHQLNVAIFFLSFQNGYMFAYPNKKDVGVHIRNPNNLKVYQFGLKYVEHCFCSECGVAVFLQPVGPPSEELETWSEERKKQLEAMLVLNPLNLHVLDGVEWEELKVTEVQGKDLPPKYVIED